MKPLKGFKSCFSPIQKLWKDFSRNLNERTVDRLLFVILFEMFSVLFLVLFQTIFLHRLVHTPVEIKKNKGRIKTDSIRTFNSVHTDSFMTLKQAFFSISRRTTKINCLIFSFWIHIVRLSSYSALTVCIYNNKKKLFEFFSHLFLKKKLRSCGY